jgi:glycosyltransferase involved in cell wall biosynthesis
MRLVYVCNEFPPMPHGGIGTFVHSIAHAMTAAGHAVTVVGLGDHSSERDDDGVRVVTLRRARLPRVSRLLDRIALYRWLRREAAAARVDVVEVPDYEGLLPFPFKAAAVVVRLHLSDTAIARDLGRRPKTAIYLAEYLTLRLHRRWISMSDFALQCTVATFGIKPRATATIPYPMPPPPVDQTVPADLPGNFVLFAGSVETRKGIYVLAQAARTFLARFPDVHLVYLGALIEEDGVRPDGRIRAIVGPELSKRVQIRGRATRDTVIACMAKARVFAFPSRLETLGLVVGEAMLAGVPVITSTNGPFPEYVRSEVSGLLVQHDDHAALSTAICRLLESPALAARLAAAARQVVAERFSLPACVKSSEAFYRSAIAPGRTGEGVIAESPS